MSLSYPERTQRARMQHSLLASSIGLVGVMLAMPVMAAQTWWQPKVSTGVEHHTNRNLSTDPATEADITGYTVDGEVTWGYLTPRTNTQLRPRVRFQRYPDQKDIQRSEQFLDFSTEHRTAERSTIDLVARYSRQDAFRSELGSAEFDDFDPEDPTEGGEGAEVVGAETRTRAQLRPTFTHEWSEVTGILIGSVLETVRFSSEISDRRDYDYVEFRSLLTRQHTPRTQFAFGPTVSRYETRDNLNQTDDYGIEFAVEHEYSEITTVGAGFFVRRSDIEVSDGFTVISETQTNYGFAYNLVRTTELGRLRFSLGRTLQPTSRGNMAVSDQLRLQYDRDYTQRLSMRTALRAYQQEAQGSFGDSRDRDYARAEISLTWMLTPTMFVSGGYQYTWRDIDRDANSADNHAVLVSLGYRGLGRPR